MSNIIERSFGLNIRILKFFTLYPTEKRSVFVKVRVYAMYFGFLVLNTFLLLVQMFTSNSQDVMQMVFNGVFCADTVGYWFKLAPILKNGDRIKKCINYFADPKFAPENAVEEEIMEECISVCRRNCMFFLCSITVTELFWTVPKLVERQLPLQLWLPFDTLKNSPAFYITFLYIFTAVMYDGNFGAMVDPLLGGLVYHATTQLKILKHRLQNLDKYVQGDQLTTYEHSCAFLERCVEHHNSILDFISEYEKCFSFSIFCQFAGSMFGLCFCCIGMILDSGSSSDSLKSAISFSCVIFQIFFHCYYGTLLLEENNGFIDAICMGPWYKYDVRVRKTLILMMERAKMPLMITAGKFVNVTLQTFASVLKSSYSLVAVVSLAINDK